MQNSLKLAPFSRAIRNCDLKNFSSPLSEIDVMHTSTEHKNWMKNEILSSSKLMKAFVKTRAGEGRERFQFTKRGLCRLDV